MMSQRLTSLLAASVPHFIGHTLHFQGSKTLYPSSLDLNAPAKCHPFGKTLWDPLQTENVNRKKWIFWWSQVRLTCELPRGKLCVNHSFTGLIPPVQRSVFKKVRY